VGGSQERDTTPKKKELNFFLSQPQINIAKLDPKLAPHPKPAIFPLTLLEFSCFFHEYAPFSPSEVSANFPSSLSHDLVAGPRMW
jgi:hypothetical protein